MSVVNIYIFLYAHVCVDTHIGTVFKHIEQYALCTYPVRRRRCGPFYGSYIGNKGVGVQCSAMQWEEAIMTQYSVCLAWS